MTEQEKPKYKMLQLDMPRYEKVEEVARKRREAARGALRPQWGDIIKELIDKHL